MRLLLVPILLLLCLWGCEESKLSIKESELHTDIETLEEFYTLSEGVTIPGVFDQAGIKFVIVDAHTTSPKLYFINANSYEDHYSFLIDALSYSMSIYEFKQKAYHVEGERQLIVGELLYYDQYVLDGIEGLFTLEFWPSDILSYEEIATTYARVSKSLLVPNRQMAYHPRGASQELAVQNESLLYARGEVPVVTTDELFKEFNFIPFNTGESYGYLRTQNNSSHYDIDDIVLLRSIPNTLSHVSGIITEIPQTPLSHINLIARQNNIPNAYVQNPLSNPEIVALIDKPVWFRVDSSGYSIEEARDIDVVNYLEKYRPKESQIPVIDTGNKQIKNLNNISFDDVSIYGSKATNLAELRRILPDEVVPDGYGIPFSYYVQYMTGNGFFDSARVMLDDPEFHENREYRKERLKSFRKLIKSGAVESDVISLFENVIRSNYPEGTSLRCRSSTNNEDLEGFSGAGLYNSYTHYLHEGDLAKSVKQVWSGSWTYRAYQEREFYRINHYDVAMGVLVHPNFKNEISNGVAVTRNIYDSDYRGFYVNVQRGEDLVTNPNAESIPEEFIISAKGKENNYETEYIRYSNQVPAGEKILQEKHIEELTYYMELIQDHFHKKYNALDNLDFAMEIEFKVTAENQLVIKQARPWL